LAGAACLLATAAALRGRQLRALWELERRDVLLRAENFQLRAQLATLGERITGIARTLDRVEGLDARLRGTGALAPPASSGSSAVPGTRLPAEAEAPAPPGLLADLDGLACLEGKASRSEEELLDLNGYFDARQEDLARVPSSWPTRGWVTSDFGARLDPFTAERMMHQGLDIATAPGAPVYAPADALVEFAGTQPGYGRVVVLDHGEGVKTRYAHLSRVLVRTGERVRGGSRIAAVGSSGRSTGPHLHYAVKHGDTYVNPQSLKVPREAPIAPQQRASFEEKVAPLRARLDAAPVA
jgi:murein DD-endopeptidase MepM/ murein hydrolase activator NlpD